MVVKGELEELAKRQGGDWQTEKSDTRSVIQGGKLYCVVITI